MPSDNELEQHLDEFRERFGLIVDLEQVSGLIDWDQQTKMPEAAGEHRAHQSAALAGIIHEKFADDRRMGELLRTLDGERDRLPDQDARAVKVALKDYERYSKLPRKLVEDLSRLESEGHGLWVEARRKDDFSLFVPALERMLELQREKAEHFGYENHPYDALHDTYESGSTAAEVSSVFGPLREATTSLLDRIRASGRTLDDSVLFRDYPEDRQEKFGREAITEFGFDFSRGRLDRAEHPFATSFGNRDVRITTRYDRNFLNPAIFGMFHEAGHGMYEQGISDDYARTPLADSASLAVHESQSRMWENLIGRSMPYWQYAWPRLQALFPAALGSVSREQFYEAINVVRPSLIRVEADEVTYNLHIMIRFELELAMLDGSLTPRDLPDAWNGLYRDYLGITPKDDAEGCLQDVHWSAGLIGYFPTYTLGNIMSVQLLEAHEKENPQLDEQVARGDFSMLHGWMRENVHRHGRSMEPRELLEHATGSKLDAAPYIRYLEKKYGQLYGFREEEQ